MNHANVDVKSILCLILDSKINN